MGERLRRGPEALTSTGCVWGEGIIPKEKRDRGVIMKVPGKHTKEFGRYPKSAMKISGSGVPGSGL